MRAPRRERNPICRSLKSVFPELFATLAVPKAEELVATPYRHGTKEKAEAFFLDGMTQAMHRLAEQSHPAYPVTIYYAFKQAENLGTRASGPHHATGTVALPGIAPVDLAQAAIGPGMAVYTRYGKVLDADGKPVAVREALALINQTLDEVLAEQEGDFDADTRWALAWFEQYGFSDGEFGVAETLSKAKNTSVEGIVNAGLAHAKGGKVRLLKPDELADDWPACRAERGAGMTVWEMVHQLVRALNKGEQAAADLVAKLGTRAETARELAYRLYTVCDRKKRAQEALAYNALVQSWPEIIRLAQEKDRPPALGQAILFDL